MTWIYPHSSPLKLGWRTSTRYAASRGADAVLEVSNSKTTPSMTALVPCSPSPKVSQGGLLGLLVCVSRPCGKTSRGWGLGQLPQQRTGGLTSAVLSVAALAVKRCVGHDRQLWEVGVAGRRGGHVCMMLMVVTRCSSRPVVLRTAASHGPRLVQAHRPRPCQCQGAGSLSCCRFLFQPFQESRAAQGPL